MDLPVLGDKGPGMILPRQKRVEARRSRFPGGCFHQGYYGEKPVELSVSNPITIIWQVAESHYPGVKPRQ